MKYDLVVLGAGAAGLMAAITASLRNRSVLVVERSNKVGKKPDKLEDFFEKAEVTPVVDYENVVGQDRIDRFDSKAKRPKRRKNNKKSKNFRGKNRSQKPKA